MSTNYLIPYNLLSLSPNLILPLNSTVEEKTIFLEKLPEKYFFDFPISWVKPIEEALGNIGNDVFTKYTFSVMSFDGTNISSQKCDMFGYEFKTYLFGLLKFAKTLVLYIINGIRVQKLIICLP